MGECGRSLLRAERSEALICDLASRRHRAEPCQGFGVARRGVAWRGVSRCGVAWRGWSEVLERRKVCAALHITGFGHGIADRIVPRRDVD